MARSKVDSSTDTNRSLLQRRVRPGNIGSIAPGAKRRGKFPLVKHFYSPSDLKTLRYRGPYHILSRSKAHRQCDYFLYTPVFKSQKKVKSWPRTEKFHSHVKFGVCMYVCMYVCICASEAPQYYFPPHSNALIQHRSARGPYQSFIKPKRPEPSRAL